MRYVWIVFIAWISKALCQSHELENFRALCRNDCQNLMLALPKYGETFSGCDWNCRKHECKYGCDHWNGDYDEKFSCQSVCSNTNNSCSSGCRDVEARKIAYVKTIAKNAIIRKNKVTSSGIDISWSLTSTEIDGVSWKVEMKLLQLDYSYWVQVNANLGITGNDITVSIPNDQLNSMSDYKIRLVAFYKSRRIDTSSETKATTLPSETKPSASPLVVFKKYLPIQNSFVLCWSEPWFKNNPIKFYTVSIGTAKIADTNSTCYIFTNLVPKREYIFTVKAVNNAGESESAAELLIVPDNALINPSLFYANNTHVMMIKNIHNFLEDPISIYNVSGSTEIVGVKALINKVLIILNNNTILHVSDGDVRNISSSIQTSIILSDEINGLLYLINNNEISVCGINNMLCNISIAKATFPVTTAALDNVYSNCVYYTTKEGLFKFPIGDPKSAMKLDYFGKSICNRLTVDFATASLLCSTSDNVEAYNLITNKTEFIKSDLLKKGTQRTYGNIQRMVSWRGKLFWISNPCSEPSSEDSCLYADEKFNNTDKLQINYFLIPPGHGKLVDLDLSYQNILEPVLLPPDNLSVLFGSDGARLFWNNPKALPFQSSALQVNSKFNIEVVTNGVKVLNTTVHNQNTYSIDFGTLKPSTVYTISIKLCASIYCSEAAIVNGSTFDNSFPLKTLDIVVATPETVYTFTPLGVNTEKVDADNSILFVANGNMHTGFYLTTDGTIYSVMENKSNSYAMPKILNATSFDYDLNGDRFYWSTNDGIFRTSASMVSAEIIFPESNMKYMAVATEKPLLIIGTESSLYSIFLTGLYNMEYFSCPSQNCELVSFETSSSAINYFYQKENQMYAVSIGFDGTKKSENAINKTPSNVKKMNTFYGKYLILLDNGQLGILEPNENQMNYFNLKNVVDFSVVTSPLTDISNTEYSLPAIEKVEFVTNSSGDEFLQWSVDLKRFPYIYFYKAEIYYANKIFNHDPIVSVITNEQNIQLKNMKFDEYNVSLTIFNQWKSNRTFWHIKSAVALPSRPGNPRLYSSIVKTPYNDTASVVFLWDPPIWNGDPLGYKVYCYAFNDKQETTTRRYFANGTDVISSATFFTLPNLQIGISVYCQVAAGNQQKGFNLQQLTTPVSIQTRNSVDPPLLLVTTEDNYGFYDFEEESFVMSATYENDNASIAIIRENIYLLANSKLFVSNISSSYEIIMNLTAPFHGYSIAGDWVGNNLFISGTDATNFQNVAIWKMDMNNGDMSKVFSGVFGVKIESMVYDALNSYLYFTENNFGSFSAYQLDAAAYAHTITKFNCDIISSALLLNISNPGRPAILGLTNYGLVDLVNCRAVIPASQLYENLNYVRKLAMNEESLFLLLPNSIVIYNTSTGKTLKIDINATDIASVSEMFHPYPTVDCLAIPSSDYSISARPISENSVEFVIDTFVWPKNCMRVSRPSVEYEVMVKPISESTCDGNTKCLLKKTRKNIMVMDGLLVNVDYDVQSSAYNDYTERHVRSVKRSFKTSAETADSPRNLKIYPVTPVMILLIWSPPTNRGRFKYAIMPTASQNIEHSLDFYISCEVDPCQFKVDNLKPSSTNSYIVYSKNESQTSDGDLNSRSNEASGSTFPIPLTLEEQVDKRTSTSLSFSWKPLDMKYIKTYRFVYAKANENVWSDFPKPSGPNYTVTNLSPDTHYQIQLLATYETSNDHDGKTVKSTDILNHTVASSATKELNNRPDAPSQLQLIKSGDSSVLNWTKPFDGGKDILTYKIEFRYDSTSIWEEHTFASVAGVLTSVQIPAKFNMSDCSQFRISAKNINGLGPATILTLPTCKLMVPKSSAVKIIIGVSVSVLILLIIGAILLAIRKKKSKPTFSSPHAGNLNLTYVPNADNSPGADAKMKIADQDIKSLPHVPRSCIVISKILGSGAFGEVFDGLAYNLQRTGQKTVRVAVKTLRPGSSDIERVKFLKEAVLMTNLNHPNIVRLLGVCIESEPHWIILELMEGGSLLNYLRSVRPTDTMPSQVSIKDLMQISLDVAKGCGYLEHIHHVHRDLAGRNCLITSRDPSLRVVKIADFGLARDVFEGDYYRVEGQGLLPVRWMAPESLLDGVFTIKSDVWSFGILLWEVMSLGKQPYQGKSNWDVINYVRLGGRLDPPDCCFPEIFQMMESCWAFDAPARPSFRELVDKLQVLTTLDQFIDDSPYPPFYSRPTSLNSQENSQSSASFNERPTSAGSETPIFATQSSGRFSRKNVDTQSNRLKNKTKQSWFDSLRGKKEAAPPPPLPTKEDVSKLPSRTSESSDAATTISVTPSSIRPDSGISGQSYTTSAEGYEVPLIKNLATAATTRVGADNLAYEPYKRREKAPVPQSRDAAANLSVEPGPGQTFTVNSGIPMTNISRKPYENV